MINISTALQHCYISWAIRNTSYYSADSMDIATITDSAAQQHKSLFQSSSATSLHLNAKE
jgi:hypothetical protein